MTRLIRRIRHNVLAPTGKTIVLGLRLNQLIWTKYFNQAWDSIPLHEKLTWIMFTANTLSILSFIQILAFKMR